MAQRRRPAHRARWPFSFWAQLAVAAGTRLCPALLTFPCRQLLRPLQVGIVYFIGAGFWTLESLWSLWVYK